MWCPVYSLPPDYLLIDQDSAYKSSQMLKNATAARVTLDEISIETPDPFG